MDQTTDPRRGAPARAFACDAAPAILRRDRILVQPSPIGYFCIGFGEAARTLRFAFDDGADACRAFGQRAHLATALDLGDIVPVPVEGPAAALAKGGDRYLNRLALLATLAKSDYDPNEPRDVHGRWTSEGGASGGTSSPGVLHQIEALFAAAGRTLSTDAHAVADAAESAVERTAAWTAESLPEIAPELATAARIGAGGFGAATAAAGAAAAVLLYAREAGAVQWGDLPYRPGLRWSSDEGRLEVSQIAPNGEWRTLFEGFAGVDGRYRTDDGLVVGQRIGVAGFSEDIKGLATLSALADAEYDLKHGITYLSPETKASIDADFAKAEEEDRPKACPTRTPENLNGRSERSIAYQEWITGVQRGWQFEIHTVSFDGCKTEARLTIEAKGPGYQTHMSSPEGFEPYYRGLYKILAQGARQSYVDALIGFRGEWYFAEPWLADYFKIRFGAIYPNLSVFYVPPPAKYPWD